MIDTYGLYRDYLTIERGFSKNTIIAYLNVINKLHTYCQDKNLLTTDLTIDDLNSFLATSIKLNHSQKTRSLYITVVRSFYRFLTKENYISVNIASKLEFPKLGLKIPNILTVSEVNTILDVIDVSNTQGKRFKAIIEVIFSSGIRVSELINIRINDLNFSEGSILITGKGNKQRIVLISDYAKLLLTDYVIEARPQLLKNKNSNYLFINNRANKISRVFILKKLKEYGTIANINKTISPHTLRHSFATSMLENGADLRSLQTFLGHEQINTTQIYTHVSKKQLRNVYDQYSMSLNKEKDNHEQ